MIGKRHQPLPRGTVEIAAPGSKIGSPPGVVSYWLTPADYFAAILGAKPPTCEEKLRLRTAIDRSRSTFPYVNFRRVGVAGRHGAAVTECPFFDLRSARVVHIGRRSAVLGKIWDEY